MNTLSDRAIRLIHEKIDPDYATQRIVAVALLVLNDEIRKHQPGNDVLLRAYGNEFGRVVAAMNDRVPREDMIG